jgi:hypothetical protein
VPRLLSIALLIALALSACGKSTEDKYKEGWPPIDRGLVALGDDVAGGLRDAGRVGDSALAGRFAAYERRLGALRDRLDGLEAPDRVSKDHQALLAATAAVRHALADIARAARRGDAAGAGDAATRLVRGEARLAEVRARLAREVRTL